MPEKLYAPSEVADIITAQDPSITVSTDTIRRYSSRFSRFLSSSANPGKGKPRLYTAEDIYMLATIKRLTEQSNTYDDIDLLLERLPVPEHFDVPEVQHSVPELPAPVAALQQIGSALERLAEQGERADKLERQVQALSSHNERLAGELSELRQQVHALSAQPPARLPGPRASAGETLQSFTNRLAELLRSLADRLVVKEQPGQAAQKGEQAKLPPEKEQ